MKLADTGLQKQPFRTHGKPLVLVPYTAQKNALRFLENTRANRYGLGLFHGPSLSGKTTIIHRFANSLPDDHLVAIVDGAHTDAISLLANILTQYGYDRGFDTGAERFKMIRVIALQQAAIGRAPVLIVENVHKMKAVALDVLAELTAMSIDGNSALRIIFSSERPRLPVFEAPALQTVESRLTGKFLLKPMTRTETATYAHKKLKSGGCNDPKAVMPPAVCNRLHEASGGRPGVIDRLAMMALAKAEHIPLLVEHIPQKAIEEQSLPNIVVPLPQLIHTSNGKTLGRIDIDKPRILIGRNALCDIDIVHEWISRQHAIIIRNEKSTMIVDLKSRNGVYINGKRIKSHVLVDNDIISLGYHRLKYVDPSATQRTSLRGAGWDDTTLAESIRDFRKGLLRELKSTN
ncbi:MAG: FHA domain-containing protein [Woeseiaceae bacterium]